MTNLKLKEILRISAVRETNKFASSFETKNSPIGDNELFMFVMKDIFTKGANSRDEIILQLCEALEIYKLQHDKSCSLAWSDECDCELPLLSRVTLASVYASLEGEK